MNKQEYEVKLAKTIVLDSSTVGQEKEAKALEIELNHFWREATLAYILKNEGEDLMAPRWTTLGWDFDLKPDGLITVNENHYNEFRGLPTASIMKRTFCVSKDKILK